MQDIFGGSNQSAQQSSQSGFSLLPQEIQNAFKSLATSSTDTLLPGGQPNSGLFKLPSLPGGASDALSQIMGQDFKITPDSIKSDINMQMDPYSGSVVNQIEKAQNGSLSQLKSMLDQSGTFGSNRGILGASDISNTAADQIGSFLSGEFNNSLGNALTTLPANRAQSAQGALGAGQFSQGQAIQNQQAPVNALSALARLMGVLPQSGGSTSQGTSEGTSNKGIFGPISLFSGGNN